MALDLPLFARRPRRIFPTSLTGDVTSEIAEDDWERGWCRCTVLEEFEQNAAGMHGKIQLLDCFYERIDNNLRRKKKITEKTVKTPA